METEKRMSRRWHAQHILEHQFMVQITSRKLEDGRAGEQ